MSFENDNSSSSNISESSDYDNESESNNNLNLLGKILKNYNIIYELGRGACSIVWLSYNINNNNYYAIKVQNPSQYNSGLMEIEIVKKLPTINNCFNNIIEHFIEIQDKHKYVCSVWNLHATDLDTIIRKKNNKTGLSLPIVKKIMKQLINSIYILHNKLKIIHCDIKTDNILIKGINNFNSNLINKYNNENFNEKYKIEKEKFWLNKGRDLTNIQQMKKEHKNKIRLLVHEEITNTILKEVDNIDKYSINDKYINDINISLADFGSYCEENEEYDSNSFGTRYYQAPEIILMGEYSYPIDIWALGCTFYELLSGKLLFDPVKDSQYSRDYYHLLLINDTCGTFPPKFLKTTKYYKQFFNQKFELKDHTINCIRLDRKINEIDTLNENDKKDIKRLLLLMLQINPTSRITINELNECLYF